MSRYTRELKSKHGAKRILPATKVVYGLEVDPQAEIAVVDAPDHLILADVDTRQEWALPKAALTDIGRIRTADLKKILNDPSRRKDSASLAFDVISSAISLDFGDMIRSMAAAASDCCLIVTYVQDGANRMLILHVGSEKASVCEKIVSETARSFGPHFRDPIHLTDFMANPDPEYDKLHCGRGYALYVCREAMYADGRLAPPPEENPGRCAQCGADMQPEDRFCPQCGAPRVQ